MSSLHKSAATKALGPRPRAHSAHIRDAILSITRRPTPNAVWFGTLGLLFNSGLIIATYFPARDVLHYDARQRASHMKHVYYWALELGVSAAPFPESDNQDAFLHEVFTELASVMHQLDYTHNPR